MTLQILSLLFLAGAIVLGFTRKINVGLVCLGMSIVLALIGGVPVSDLYDGFPSKLFITLLGTMFFFCLLQENKTLELLSKRMVAMVGNKTALIPVILYVVSYLLSAAGPGAISVQSVMIILAVSLAVQMDANPIFLGSMSILGAVGGSASPIALTGIIVSDLTSEMGIENIAGDVFIGVSVANIICAAVLYIFFKGYRLKARNEIKMADIEAFNKNQKICLLALVALVVAVVGFRLDVGFVCFTLSLILIIFRVVDNKAAMKLIPWSVLILICGVNVLMTVTKTLGGIDLLSNMLSTLMNEYTAAPIMTFTAGIMSWFSSANGVVMPTLIPTAADIAANVGGSVTALELIMGVVGGSTVAGISPLSTGGSLILASYSQEKNIDSQQESKIFAKLFLISFCMVVIEVVFALLGGFKLFC